MRTVSMTGMVNSTISVYAMRAALKQLSPPLRLVRSLAEQGIGMMKNGKWTWLAAVDQLDEFTVRDIYYKIKSAQR